MKIVTGNSEADFFGWRPELGRVFHSIFSFDTETTLIDEERDWLVPAYVLGAVFDGNRGFFLRREHVAAFFEVHRDLPIIMHRASFDLSVVHAIAPQLDIYELVERNQVWDTQLLHRLLTLAVAGHTARGKDQSTLETCAREYLGVELPKSLKDSDGEDVRLCYAKWLNHPPQEIEPIYLEYLGKDVMATLHVYSEVMRRLHETLYSSWSVWGYVDQNWLTTQIQRWGYQTHHIQLKGSIVLQAIKATGLQIDKERTEELASHLASVTDEYRRTLREMGYLPGQPGSDKALQGIFRELERKHPEVSFPRTPTGKFETKTETLEDLALIEPFVRTLMEFKSVEKLRSSFLGKMGRQCVHPSFDPLLVTGRTSSFGDLNAQNLPRDDRVRSCFIPSAGNVFLDADYATVEMATLAQAVQSQFGLISAMGGAINAGRDLHTLVAARVTGKAEQDVTSEERRKAKPINFGKPGGMGDAGLQRYAKSSYGVELSTEEVEQLTRSWLDLFPEMNHFLSQDSELGEDIARYFALTPATYADVTGSREWLDRNPGQEQIPNPILGWMFRKVLLEKEPHTRNGEPYSDQLIDYCWKRAGARIGDFTAADQADIAARCPTARLARSASRIAEQKGCFTLSGRLRANASYCARHNSLFQGLAADGAKLALWRLWREKYRIVNFIHDEVLIEVPIDSDLKHHAGKVREIMVGAMREVVPDVAITVEFAATDRWYKSADAVYDTSGRLVLWTPEATNAKLDSEPPSSSGMPIHTSCLIADPEDSKADDPLRRAELDARV